MVDDGAAMGRRVRSRRALLGWRQEELAERAGVRRETVSALERGVGRPRLETVRAVARALGVAVGELVI